MALGLAPDFGSRYDYTPTGPVMEGFGSGSLLGTNPNSDPNYVLNKTKTLQDWQNFLKAYDANQGNLSSDTANKMQQLGLSTASQLRSAASSALQRGVFGSGPQREVNQQVQADSAAQQKAIQVWESGQASGLLDQFRNAVASKNYNLAQSALQAVQNLSNPSYIGTSPTNLKAIQDQLAAGFRASGRSDLAAAVYTPDFTTWINAESGWHPGIASPANNQGKPNYGLFQFWAGHPWTGQYVQNGQFTATPYQQAQLAAQYFPNLSVSSIAAYAQAIRNGSYQGWG